MKFKNIKNLVSKTDAISIMFVSTGGEVDCNYINSHALPDKYDNMDVIGFGYATDIKVDNKQFKDVSLTGVEFMLDNTSDDVHKLREKKEGIEDEQNNDP